MPKEPFVFLAPSTSKQPAKQDEKRRRRVLASMNKAAKEKQAVPKEPFVFLAPSTSKQPAKQDEKRRRRVLASMNKAAKEKRAKKMQRLNNLISRYIF